MKNRTVLTRTIFSGIVSCLIIVPCAAFAMHGYGYSYGYGYDDHYGYGYSHGDIKEDKYKHYKEQYKNHDAKTTYQNIKQLKKDDAQGHDRYEHLQSLYEQYEHLSDDDRQEILSEQDYADFQEYNEYKGYKKYKELRKDMGL